jgi:hypothetical protein
MNWQCEFGREERPLCRKPAQCVGRGTGKRIKDRVSSHRLKVLGRVPCALPPPIVSFAGSH